MITYGIFRTIIDKYKYTKLSMSSDKEKRSKAEALLSQFKQETSKIEGLDPAIQQYLDQRFDRIEEMLEKILKRIDWRE